MKEKLCDGDGCDYDEMSVDFSSFYIQYTHTTTNLYSTLFLSPFTSLYDGPSKTLSLRLYTIDPPSRALSLIKPLHLHRVLLHQTTL